MGFEQRATKIYPYAYDMSRWFGDLGVFNHSLPGIPPLRPSVLGYPHSYIVQNILDRELLSISTMGCL